MKDITELKAHIRARIEEIKAVKKDNDDHALYLQGCSEELERLLSRIG